MIKWCALLVTTVSLMNGALPESTPEQECETVANASQSLSFSVGRRRNQTGHWVTTASAYKEIGDLMVEVDLQVRHRVIDCGGRPMVHIRGVLSEIPSNSHLEKLSFHPKGGKNVDFTNGRRTAYRKNENDNNGVAFTNRPLKRNTMLEVRWDKGTTKFSYSLGIGVTAHSPDDLDIPDHMNTLKSGTWIYYDKRVFNNGTIVFRDTKINLNEKNEFQVGDHVGVIVKDSGFLHFFVNGIEQAAVKANLPHSVYGFIELRGNAVQVSIVDVPS